MLRILAGQGRQIARHPFAREGHLTNVSHSAQSASPECETSLQSGRQIDRCVAFWLVEGARLRDIPSLGEATWPMSRIQYNRRRQNARHHCDREGKLIHASHSGWSRAPDCETFLRSGKPLGQRLALCAINVARMRDITAVGNVN